MNRSLRQTLATLSLAAVISGCGTTSDNEPLVPEIASISINETNETTRIHSFALDTDNNQSSATVLYSDGESSEATYQLD